MKSEKNNKNIFRAGLNSEKRAELETRFMVLSGRFSKRFIYFIFLKGSYDSFRVANNTPPQKPNLSLW